MAVKATYVEIEGRGREIYKSPITDDGTKKSAKGLLMIERRGIDYYLQDQVSVEQEEQGSLRTVFQNGKLVESTNLDEIRNRINNYINKTTTANSSKV